MHPRMHILRGMHRITPKPGVIATYCEQTGISRDELSRRMGVSTVTAWRVDTGRVDPSPGFIARLMDVTGLGFEALFAIERDGDAA